MHILLLSGMGGSDLQPEMNTAAFAAALPIVNMCLRQILPIFMMISLTYTLCKGYMQSASLQIDLGPIIRMFLILVLLVSYRTMVPLIGDTIGAVTSLIKEPLAGQQVTAMIQGLAPPAAVGVPPVNPLEGGNVQDWLTYQKDSFSNALSAITDFSVVSFLSKMLTEATITLVRTVMLYVRMFILGFLFISGPLAIVLSIVPGFDGLLKNWLQNFVSVQMWSVTFALIDVLFKAYTTAALSNSGWLNLLPGGSLASGRDQVYMISCLVFIILNLMVPYMTTLLIGGSAVSSFIGSVAGAAAATAGTVASAGAGAAAGAGVSGMGGGGSLAQKAGSLLGRTLSSSGGGSKSAPAETPAAAPAAPPMMVAPVTPARLV